MNGGLRPVRAAQSAFVALAVVAACAPMPGGAGQAPASGTALPGKGLSSPSGTSSASETPAPPATASRLKMQIVQRYPHDPHAFTQGLLWHEGYLYESTGLYGHSSLRRVALDTGQVLDLRPLDDQLFGEGLARVGERLIALSWKAGLATVFDLRDLAPIAELSYQGEGWGLAYDPRTDRLVMSDGTSRLTFRDRHSFAPLQTVEVTLEGRPLAELNELEVVGDSVWANLWQRERIVRIDASSGRVTGVVDLDGLLSAAERRGTDVLNGIAYDHEKDLFYVTGKLWPALFAVRFIPAEALPAPPSGA